MSGSPHPRANGAAKGLGAFWDSKPPPPGSAAQHSFLGALHFCLLLGRQALLEKRSRADLGLSDAHLVINASIVNRTPSVYIAAWLVPWGQRGWIFLGCIRASQMITSGAKDSLGAAMSTVPLANALGSLNVTQMGEGLISLPGQWSSTLFRISD